MDLSFGIGMFVGLGATLILMYLVLRKYTYPKVEQPFFSDPSLFMLFAVGLVSGTILYMASTYLNLNNVIYAILFAIIQGMLLLVCLNLKRYSGKSDTIFYGYGLGLGLGGAMATGLIYQITYAMQVEFDLASMVIVCIMGVAQIMMLSAVGATIGEGVARQRPWEFLMQGLIVNTVFMVCWSLARSTLATGNTITYLYLALMVVVAVWYFYRTMFTKLSFTVDEILRQNGIKRDDIPR